MKRIAAASLLIALLSAFPAGAINCLGTSTGATPLSDLGLGSYKGFEGGLYSGGANHAPAPYETIGETLARAVTPLDSAGVPNPNGMIVFLTIGMSNTRLESAQLMPLANADPLRDSHVLVVNGAEGGMDAEKISDPASPYWPFVDDQLKQAGVTAQQVQTVWLKEAIAGPAQFGAFPAHAQRLQQDLAKIVGILAGRFPNLRLVYPSSRIYAGYATTTLNPEPYAYESGFSVKWLIADRMQNPATIAAPWVGWGPYLWADGLTPRSDGLVWLCAEYNTDGTHPNTQGAIKVAKMILDFLHADPTAKIWYESA